MAGLSTTRMENAEEVHPFSKIEADTPTTRHTIRSMQRPTTNLPKPFKHSEVDPITYAEVKGPVVNVDILPLSVFPYAALPGQYRSGDEKPMNALQGIFRPCMEMGLYQSSWTEIDAGDPGTEPEQQIAEAFNHIVDAAEERTPTTTEGYLTWRSHSNVLNSENRKPDVVLVDRIFGNTTYAPTACFMSYCEVKSTSNAPLHGSALQQLSEIAGLATSGQFGRRFYVAMSLCGSQLTVACFIRGCTIFTTPFDIHKEPLLFIHILLTITAGDAAHVWTGIDPRYKTASPASSHRVTIPLPCVGQAEPNSPVPTDAPQKLILKTLRTIFQAQGMEGKGTVVTLCTATSDKGKRRGTQVVLKECWPPADWPDDIDIHLLLNTHVPENILEAEKAIFGPEDKYGIFRDCQPVAHEWDESKYLPGIPIAHEWQRLQCHVPNPPYPNDDWENVKPVEEPDTTSNIVRRFKKHDPAFSCTGEPRSHILIVSRTCGVLIENFSCRREFLLAFMGALVGHYNGLLKGVLHCDVSLGNIWIRVAALPDDAVPAWKDLENGEYVRRPGMMGDWGSGQDVSKQNGKGENRQGKKGFVTGTYPYVATELLEAELGQRTEVRHKVEHDLESFFWVLWELCVNLSGPYGKKRAWGSSILTSPSHAPAATTTTTTTITTTTTPTTYVDMIPTTNMPRKEPFEASCLYGQDSRSCGVPTWAVDSAPLKLTTGGIHQWRVGANEHTVIDPISPYFAEGPGGREFIEGMKKLWAYFQPTASKRLAEDLITHKNFVDILYQMYQAQSALHDHPSKVEEETAREMYKKNFHEIMQVPAGPPRYSKTKTGGRTLKRPSEPLSGTAGSKRSRTGEKTKGAGLSEGK